MLDLLQYNTVQYSTVQYSTIQYSTVQYSTVQYSKVQYNTVRYSTVQYNTVQYNTIQYSTVQYSTVQYNTIQTHESQRRIRNIKERVRKILVLQKKTFWLSCLKSRRYANKNRCEVRFPFCAAAQILLEIRDDCSYKSIVC